MLSINNNLTRPVYGLSFDDVDIAASRRLIGEGDLATLNALPLSHQE